MKKVFGWYVVEDNDIRGDDNYAWCHGTFGPPNEVGRWFYSLSSHLFYFKNERDATLFELGFGHEHSAVL